MAQEIPTQSYRGNDKLKQKDITEYVTEAEYRRRVEEIIKCKNDAVYFANTYYTIVSGKGKHIIELYPKQADLLRFIVDNRRCIVKCPRQCAKSTTNCVFSLWHLLFNNDKKILLVANKLTTVLELLERIQMAYEELPLWLKPGITTWNKGRLVFSNGSSIEGCSTTSTSSRGKSAEILVIDEMAWIPANFLEAFLTSVLPVVSSFPESKIIGVSTPNGTNNKYYELYQAAQMNIDNEEGWKKFDICLDDVPGRDETWRKERLAEFNGDLIKYRQEYECVFHGSSYTLLPQEIIDTFKHRVLTPEYQEPKKIGFTRLREKGEFFFHQWHPPEKDHVYVLGADTSSGIGKDLSTVLVFDVTNVCKIKHVASFGSSAIKTLDFPYVIVKLGRMYNNALVAMESNSIGDGVLNFMAVTYEYDNIFSYENTRSQSKRSLGIFSHLQIKNKACRWLRDMSALGEISMELNDKYLIAEMEWFERKESVRHEIFQANGTKHDDYMMAFVWAMWAINPEVIETYLYVEKFIKTSVGIQLPWILKNTSSGYFEDEQSSFAPDWVGQNTDPDEVYSKHIMKEEPSYSPDHGEIEKLTGEDIPDNLGFTEGEDIYDWDDATEF